MRKKVYSALIMNTLILPFTELKQVLLHTCLIWVWQTYAASFIRLAEKSDKYLWVFSSRIWSLVHSTENLRSKSMKKIRIWGKENVSIGTQTCCTEFNSRNLCTDVEETRGSRTRPWRPQNISLHWKQMPWKTKKTNGGTFMYMLRAAQRLSIWSKIDDEKSDRGGNTGSIKLGNRRCSSWSRA